jgi:hypothetical protein
MLGTIMQQALQKWRIDCHDAYCHESFGLDTTTYLMAYSNETMDKTWLREIGDGIFNSTVEMEQV